AFAQVCGLRAGGLRAGGDPLLDQFNLIAGQFLVALRHFAVSDQIEKQAPAGLARHKDRAVVTALENQSAQAQVETAFEFLAFAVTLEAMRLEDRTDVFLEHWRSGGEDGREGQPPPADHRGNLASVHIPKSMFTRQKQRARRMSFDYWLGGHAGDCRSARLSHVL